MLSIPGSLKIYLATGPVDFRKSHDGLAAVVEQALQEDPLSGSLFVFTNKRADRVKLLYWDSDGYVHFYKQLKLESFVSLGLKEGLRNSRSAPRTSR